MSFLLLLLLTLSTEVLKRKRNSHLLMGPTVCCSFLFIEDKEHQTVYFRSRCHLRTQGRDPLSYAVHSKVLAEPDIEVPRYGSLKAVAPEGRARRFANNELSTEALEEERESEWKKKENEALSLMYNVFYDGF